MCVILFVAIQSSHQLPVVRIQTGHPPVKSQSIILWLFLDSFATFALKQVIAEQQDTFHPPQNDTGIL